MQTIQLLLPVQLRKKQPLNLPVEMIDKVRLDGSYTFDSVWPLPQPNLVHTSLLITMYWVCVVYDVELGLSCYL